MYVRHDGEKWVSVFDFEDVNALSLTGRDVDVSTISGFITMSCLNDEEAAGLYRDIELRLRAVRRPPISDEIIELGVPSE